MGGRVSRWPFCFDLDDVSVTDDPDHPDGVVIVHYATDTRVTMNALASRDANLQAGFRRLHLAVQRKQQPQS
jgi:hypothetical protein